jgi:hypothetical protein
MKNFNQFFAEAKTTSASQQAKRLGLVGDGHGDWYDKQGALKAKTVKGKLVFFDGQKNKSADQGSPEGQAVEPQIQQKASSDSTDARRSGPSVTTADVASKQAGRSASGGATVNPPAEGGRALTVAFDRFDDASVADNMFATLENVGGQYFVFPSRNADIQSLKEAYPEFAESIIDDEDAETIFDVLQTLNDMGHNNINIVVRQSRANQTEELVGKYNGDLYNFSSINYIPVEERSVREQYVDGDILQIGAIVENVHGQVGEIIRRGANHLICVTEGGEMFKSWIRDVVEV